MTYVLKVRRRYRGHLDYKNNLHINQLQLYLEHSVFPPILLTKTKQVQP